MLHDKAMLREHFAPWNEKLKRLLPDVPIHSPGPGPLDTRLLRDTVIRRNSHILLLNDSGGGGGGIGSSGSASSLGGSAPLHARAPIRRDAIPLEDSVG